MKKKYGEITMLDFPQFTKDTFPGVTHMDLFSGLFGDVTDDSMYTAGVRCRSADQMRRVTRSSTPRQRGQTLARQDGEQDEGYRHGCQHISNNAPRDICEHDAEKRKAGIAVAKNWLDAASSGREIHAREQRRTADSCRAAAGKRRIIRRATTSRNTSQLHRVLQGNGGLRRQGGCEGHAGKSLGPHREPHQHRIIMDDVNNPFCEASPDFCNWEHEYLLYNGLKALAPYAHTNVHAKYWSRWEDKNDVRRSVKIMMDAKFEAPSHWSTKRVRGTASRARSISTRKCWPRSNHS